MLVCKVSLVNMLTRLYNRIDDPMFAQTILAKQINNIHLGILTQQYLSNKHKFHNARVI